MQYLLAPQVDQPQHEADDGHRQEDQDRVLYHRWAAGPGDSTEFVLYVAKETAETMPPLHACTPRYDGRARGI